MFLLILLTATMLIRPGEVFPDLEGLPFYLWIIATAILFNFERILKQLQTRSIRSRPMLASMLGILFAGFMSHLLSLRTIDAREYIDLFIRIGVFYLLLTGVVTTKYRLITMLKCVAFFSIIEVGMAVTDYLGYYDFPAIKSVSETYTDPLTHIPHEFMRMCGTGLFADPNDLCMLISVGATLCFYFMTRSFLGIFWAVPLGFLIYAITLTHSRGGLLSLVAAGITIFIAKFGWRKMTPLIVMAVPFIFLLGGRQTAITTGEGTGQSRVQLWSAGFTAIVTERSPCFGIGVNRYAEVAGQVAHNSFVQAYVETGFVGGTCFFALFYYGIVNLYRVKRYGTEFIDPELIQIQPYLLGMLVGVSVSMMSLTRNLTVPVYLFSGLVECYLLIISAQIPFLIPPLDRVQLKRIIRASLIFLLTLYFYTKASVRFGP